MDRRVWVVAAITMLVLGAAGCGPTLREGPNITGVPEGFLYDENATSGRPVLPQRRLVSQSGWMTLNEPHCSIMFTEYEGVADAGEISAARSEYARRYTHETYGALEPLKIDQRAAWGWTESQTLRGALASLEYTAVVPYDDATWTIEFYAADPKHRDPAFLKQLVTSFRLGKRTRPFVASR
jgi:hypothetical protein